MKPTNTQRFNKWLTLRLSSKGDRFNVAVTDSEKKRIAYSCSSDQAYNLLIVMHDLFRHFYTMDNKDREIFEDQHDYIINHVSSKALDMKEVANRLDISMDIQPKKMKGKYITNQYEIRFNRLS